MDPLKLTLGKSDVDALPENIRPLYIERNGSFALNIDGDPVNEWKTKAAEFRDNNIGLLKQVDELRPLAERFKGVDPDEYRALKAEREKITKKLGGKHSDDLEAMISEVSRAEAAALVKPLQESFASEQRRREEAERVSAASMLRENIAAVATKAGVNPAALHVVYRQAQDVFDYKDGAVIAKPGKHHPDDPMKDLTPDAWIGQLARSDGYLFTSSTGGGTSPSPYGARGNGSARELINPTPLEKGKHAAEILSGKVVVVHR